ncbi:hypothetical protein MJH12_13910 [bacterium]|nr:hypothetical protein [bacterium]
MDKNKKSDGFDDAFFNKLLLVITISSFVGFTFLSFYARSKEQSPDRVGKKECYLIQKSLSDQLNLYEKNKKSKLMLMSSKAWQDIVLKKVILKVPKDPQCEQSDHYRRDQMGNVFCLYHGSFEGVTNDYAELLLGKADCKN